jgi:hypothetical protein
MTISFLTLFFGLISGPFPVEMAVSGPVAAVELTVDGGAPVRLVAPPWATTLDFGTELLPHRVVARALDEHGSELARAEEWANLPHPKAKAEIVLEAGPDGVPRAARVAWTNLLEERLEARTLSFDGRPLRLDAAGRARLPAHDLRTVHILTAEVRFSPGRTVVRKEVAYGGEYGGEVSTELTAVPLRLHSGALPPPQKLRGWLTAGGQPLSVAAMEDGPGQLVVVRVPSFQDETKKVGSKGLLPVDIQFEMRLGREDRIHFVNPYPDRIEGSDQAAELFNLSVEYAYRDSGLPFLLRSQGVQASSDSEQRPGHPSPAPGPEGGGAFASEGRHEMRIADAVAVAGLEALTDNRRRAVLLVLNGDELEDYSRYDADRVRRFLATIHVPFFVWTLKKPVPGSFATSWGPTVEVDKVVDLYRAVADVRRELRDQRIVLVDGRFLPQSLALGPAARGVELAGGN